jgi:hypothetical protein
LAYVDNIPSVISLCSWVFISSENCGDCERELFTFVLLLLLLLLLFTVIKVFDCGLDERVRDSV